ncbi:MAG: protein translocase subunit SecD [Gammaproteobacteria bacterium]|nr:protein translocase subunit SecD [Gammaproteobacteria bacterium]
MGPNQFPWWKNLLVVLIILVGALYALPNLYGTDPAIQISANEVAPSPNQDTLKQIDAALQKANLNYTSAEWQPHGLLLRFNSTDTQFRAKEIIQETLGNSYIAALNLASSTPKWLHKINATPMKLGLDLRGGVHFLVQVDVDSVTRQHIENNLTNIGQSLRDERVRYSDMSRVGSNGIALQFRTQDALNAAKNLVTNRFQEFTWKVQPSTTGNFILQGTMSPAALHQISQDTLEQAMNTLRNRVNELGVSEAIVQQQGATRISIDLPGIQDTAQAENILGKTATLEFHMVHAVTAADGSTTPAGTTSYSLQGQNILLDNLVILRGSAITSAMSTTGDDGLPVVNIRLGGGGETLFTKTTAENIGQRLAILYVEVKSNVTEENGQKVIHYETERHVISAPVIQAALGNSFSIVGLKGYDEARTLALLLRAGALPAPITIIESRQVGPNLGKQNIHMGVISVEVGFILVVLFMALYYRGMGIIANLALTANLILIVAILSLLGATLTLPGIAGIVLTMGMAVDANVLIFERIREELRNQSGIQSSIYAGYDRAFTTIVDANLTTLIVAVVLFSLGSGTIKNFAVTLTVGLVTSMFTAITGTRAIVNLLYGNRLVRKISIGI